MYRLNEMKEAFGLVLLCLVLLAYICFCEICQGFNGEDEKYR